MLAATRKLKATRAEMKEGRFFTTYYSLIFAMRGGIIFLPNAFFKSSIKPCFTPRAGSTYIYFLLEIDQGLIKTRF